MKINKFLLVGIFLMAIISLGAVSAADDADSLTVNDDAEAVESSADEIDVVAEDGDDVNEKQDVYDMWGEFGNHLAGAPSHIRYCQMMNCPETYLFQ